MMTLANKGECRILNKQVNVAIEHLSIHHISHFSGSSEIRFSTPTGLGFRVEEHLFAGQMQSIGNRLWIRCI